MRLHLESDPFNVAVSANGSYDDAPKWWSIVSDSPDDLEAAQDRMPPQQAVLGRAAAKFPPPEFCTTLPNLVSLTGPSHGWCRQAACHRPRTNDPISDSGARRAVAIRSHNPGTAHGPAPFTLVLHCGPMRSHAANKAALSQVLVPAKPLKSRYFHAKRCLGGKTLGGVTDTAWAD